MQNQLLCSKQIRPNACIIHLVQNRQATFLCKANCQINLSFILQNEQALCVQDVFNEGVPGCGLITNLNKNSLSWRMRTRIFLFFYGFTRSWVALIDKSISSDKVSLFLCLTFFFKLQQSIRPILHFRVAYIINYSTVSKCSKACVMMNVFQINVLYLCSLLTGLFSITLSLSPEQYQLVLFICVTGLSPRLCEMLECIKTHLRGNCCSSANCCSLINTDLVSVERHLLK